MNVSKGELEGAFADELALLQPTAGYMRLVKDRILHVWEQRRAEAKDRTAEQEKRVKVTQQLDRLDEGFLFAQSIDATSYERQRDRLREELTLAQIDHPPRPSTNSTYRASWRSQNRRNGSVFQTWRRERVRSARVTFALRATVDILRVACHPKLTQTMAGVSEGW